MVAQVAADARRSLTSKTESAHSQWGWLPLLSVVAAIGVLLIAAADTIARYDDPRTDMVFWAGIGIMYLPLALRACLKKVANRERVGLIICIAIGFYMAKLLHSPIGVTFPDEFYHWRTTNDILMHHELFVINPLLPASSLFPALESIVSAVAMLSGLSIFASGMIVVGVIKVTLMLCIYLIMEHATRSQQVAGIATVVYATNSNFIFFNSLLKYETVALLFAALLLLVIVLRMQSSGWRRWALSGLTLATIIALTASHHMTTYLIIALLAVWTLVSLILSFWTHRQEWKWLGSVLLASIFSAAIWVAFIAPATINYLAPVLTGAVKAVVNLIASETGVGTTDAGDGSARTPFAVRRGAVPTPRWEQLMTFGSVPIITLSVLIGLVLILRHFRLNPLVITLGLATSLYPVSLGMRMTGAGWESGNRSSGTVFLALGLVMAITWVWLLRGKRWEWLSRLVIIGMLAVLVTGGIVSGMPYEWRMPRPYMVTQDPRTIKPESIELARWGQATLGPNHRVGADRTNDLLLGSYGEQTTMSTISGGINPGWVLFSSTIDADKLQDLQSSHVQYLVFDQRLRDAPWVFMRYSELTDPDSAFQFAYQKFNVTPGIERVYDSGNIVVFDVRTLSDAQ